MPFAVKLAWRYFRSTRKGLVRFTSLAATIGIAAGVGTLIIAHSLANGFADEMREKVLGNNAHILISDKGETRISNWQLVKTKIEETTGVSEVDATTYESAVISNGEKSSYALLRVKQLEAERESNGKGESRISLGKVLAEKLNLKVGDQAEVLGLEKGKTPKYSMVFVRSTFETGFFEYDSTWVYLSESDYLTIKGTKKFSPTVFAVSVEDPFQADKIADDLRKILGKDFKVLGWQQANQPLFAALSLERRLSYAIIFLIIFIAALNITTTLALLINERKIDIAVLRTCGARTKTLVSIFLIEGIILSVSGILLGAVLGLLACYLGNVFRVVGLTKEVYSLNYVPFHPEFPGVLAIILLTFALCLTAMIYPALRVSKIKPLENIRSA